MRRVFKTFTAVFLAMVITAAPCALAAYRGYIETPTLDGSVFLRSGGSMGYPAIGYGNNDDSLTIHRIGSRWDRVTITSGVGYGKTGWMYNGYIKLLRDREDITSWGALARVKDAYADRGVKLYRGPGSRYGTKRTVYGDDIIIILRKFSANWYKVQLGHTFAYGYMYKPRLTNGVYATVYEDALLYRRASYNSQVLDEVLTGEEIIVLNVGAKWSKVRYGVYTGYIANQYVDLDGEIIYDDEDEEDYDF